MTVVELINLLTNFPSNLPVVIDGYEGGLEALEVVSRTMIVFHRADGGTMYGEYEAAYSADKNKIDAAYLPRRQNHIEVEDDNP